MSVLFSLGQMARLGAFRRRDAALSMSGASDVAIGEVALAPPCETAVKARSDIRIPALDGLRGLMTLFVVFSHYFGEEPHGVAAFCAGWVAVIVFFVLSGYLVGRLIIEKMSAGNFLRVFYLRRVCRTFPTYFFATAVILLLQRHFGDTRWVGVDARFPTWAFFVFFQNFLFNHLQSYGSHWLSPTWTLALEEQFYLVAPFVLLLTPRRLWLRLLIALGLVGLGLRAYGVLAGHLTTAPLALLPAATDVLFAGMVVAILVKDNRIDWDKYSLLIRSAPIVCLALTFAAEGLDGYVVGPWFQILGPFFTGIGAGCFILMLVKGAPEAKRFESKTLRFFGNISYSVYLTHLIVLGLMHGLILGGSPDVATPAQIAVTVAALPITFGVGWLMTRILEEPITEWGRGHRWK